MDRRSRRGLRGIAIAAVAAVAILAMLAFLPAARTSVGPASVSVRAALGAGRTVVQIPPVGSVSAPTHPVPLTLTLTLVQLDIRSLGHALVDAESRGALAARMAVDLKRLTIRLTAQLVLAAVVIGGITGLLMSRRSWKAGAAGAAGAVVAVVGLIGATAAVYDVEAFREPRFTGALRKAPVIINAVQRGDVTLPAVRSRYRTAAVRLEDLLATLTSKNADPRAGTTKLLHISDIHSNPLGLELAAQLAARFRVDAVVDTGDIASYGLPIETGIGNFVERLRLPYLWVPGNHDSRLVRRAMTKVSNVTVLAGEAVAVDGITILGWPDPTYTNWDSIPVEEANRLRLQEAAAVADAVDRLRPDILAVHDARLAEESYGLVPIVLAGHDHRRSFEERDGTMVLRVGSTGATGLKGFTVEGERDYEAEIVYLRNGELDAIDYIRLRGLGRDFEISRQTIDG